MRNIPKLPAARVQTLSRHFRTRGTILSDIKERRWRALVKMIVCFVAGVFWGAIYTAEVPSGTIAKAAMLIKIIFWG